MNKVRLAVFTVFLALASMLVAPMARAQVVFDVGVQPVCVYGYYDYPPYDCAPDGFYGPEYFYNGIFIGVGPWAYWGHEHGWGYHHFVGGHVAGRYYNGMYHSSRIEPHVPFGRGGAPRGGYRSGGGHGGGHGGHR